MVELGEDILWGVFCFFMGIWPSDRLSFQLLAQIKIGIFCKNIIGVLEEYFLHLHWDFREKIFLF